VNTDGWDERGCRLASMCFARLYIWGCAAEKGGSKKKQRERRETKEFKHKGRVKCRES
jgi:hypothetical protein